MARKGKSHFSLGVCVLCTDRCSSTDPPETGEDQDQDRFIDDEEEEDDGNQQR